MFVCVVGWCLQMVVYIPSRTLRNTRETDLQNAKGNYFFWETRTMLLVTSNEMESVSHIAYIPNSKMS